MTMRFKRARGCGLKTRALRAYWATGLLAASLFAADLLTVGGCGELTCPQGSDLVEGRCIPFLPVTDLRPCEDGCPAEAPYCDGKTESCVPCIGNEHCLDANVPICSRNRCVACTEEQNERCGDGAFACSEESGTCTETPIGSKSLCETCVADSECREGMLCVPTRVEGEVQEYACMWRREAVSSGGPGGDCIDAEPPFIEGSGEDKVATSISGLQAVVCRARVSTCRAYRDAVAETSCRVSGNNPTRSCGYSGLEDGVCENGSCTLPCSIDIDCPADFACDGFVTGIGTVCEPL